MKKWMILLAFIIVLSVTGLSVYAYQTIREPLYHHYEQAERYVIGQSLLSTIYHVDYYHGTDAYYVFTGLDEEETETIVWVSAQYDSHHIEKASDGITKEEAIAIVTNENAVERIQTAKLGLERGLPVYEITFLNNENRKGYYYITFEDGTFMKRYLLRTN
ncbi:DUF5590 domain-containing protein [Alkalihalobacillus sp. MEB130]|uniref:cell wall elongation regulator TseB-like domain-containing protein n=1 Tax=Alkalihalobacillus sp. MEB130 TaxID=2976704 RepID=UPI0028DFFAA5|nr:DUF5590 domain-containing protein [Alkalihalobacillus sp. MEB130]MDT8859974.1 DUF5590 domain-containing protein [Alkalihalobacillus sp. MEB130]